MYATIRKYEAEQSAIDEIKQRVEHDFVPLISPIKGFLGYYWVDSEDGFASFSLFEDRAGAEESNRVAETWVKGVLSQFVRNQVEITSGEVLISEAR
ncbi:MAG TPA: hypothetical protein VH186_04920 [Chloroflexia bacterium]|nr:hypothetical protein [Chloroflexia bacterium]